MCYVLVGCKRRVARAIVLRARNVELRNRQVWKDVEVQTEKFIRKVDSQNDQASSCLHSEAAILNVSSNSDYLASNEYQMIEL